MEQGQRVSELDGSETLGVIGASEPFASAMEHARTVARTDSTVLIQGETGTGKELIAHAIHVLGGRPGAFVRVNCAAIPGSLLESELMGHERGAFTGAFARRIGRFELANEGTIFLDEIGELPLELQPKLLRLLQAREFERLGGTRTFRCSARVVSATNRNLASLVAAGTFREDLYYRLNVFPINVPPLRARSADIVLLAQSFTRTLAVRMGKPVPVLTDEVLAKLTGHSWPGNVRELQNIIERSLILTHGTELRLAELDPISSVSPTAGPRSSDGLDAMSRAHILRVLQETNWVVGGPHGAAARLEMNRSTLNFRMRKLGIVRPCSGASARAASVAND